MILPVFTQDTANSGKFSSLQIYGDSLPLTYLKVTNESGDVYEGTIQACVRAVTLKVTVAGIYTIVNKAKKDDADALSITAINISNLAVNYSVNIGQYNESDMLSLYSDYLANGDKSIAMNQISTYGYMAGYMMNKYLSSNKSVRKNMLYNASKLNVLNSVLPNFKLDGEQITDPEAASSKNFDELYESFKKYMNVVKKSPKHHVYIISNNLEGSGYRGRSGITDKRNTFLDSVDGEIELLRDIKGANGVKGIPNGAVYEFPKGLYALGSGLSFWPVGINLLDSVGNTVSAINGMTAAKLFDNNHVVDFTYGHNSIYVKNETSDSLVVAMYPFLVFGIDLLLDGTLYNIVTGEEKKVKNLIFNRWEAIERLPGSGGRIDIILQSNTKTWTRIDMHCNLGAFKDDMILIDAPTMDLNTYKKLGGLNTSVKNTYGRINDYLTDYNSIGITRNKEYFGDSNGSNVAYDLRTFYYNGGDYIDKISVPTDPDGKMKSLTSYDDYVFLKNPILHVASWEETDVTDDQHTDNPVRNTFAVSYTSRSDGGYDPKFIDGFGGAVHSSEDVVEDDYIRFYGTKQNPNNTMYDPIVDTNAPVMSMKLPFRYLPE